MNYQKLLKRALLSKENKNMATVAVIGGVAVGIALGVLFATKNGKVTRAKIADLFLKLTGKAKKLTKEQQLGNLVENVRERIRMNAEGLLGTRHAQEQASKVRGPHVPSSNWKEQKEKTIFPDERNLKL